MIRFGTKTIYRGERSVALSSNGWWYCYWHGLLYGYQTPCPTLERVADKAGARRYLAQGLR